MHMLTARAHSQMPCTGARIEVAIASQFTEAHQGSIAVRTLRPSGPSEANCVGARAQNGTPTSARTAWAAQYNGQRQAFTATLTIEDPILLCAEHLLVCCRDGAIAERLEREDREGLLDVDAHLLDAEEEEGDHDLCGDRRPVVPRLAELAPQGEGQHEEEDGEEARREARVDQRDGRLEDALVRAGQVDKHGDGRVDARGMLHVDVRLAQRRRHGAQAEHRPVARLHRVISLRPRDEALVHKLVELHAQRRIVRWPTKEVAQRADERTDLGRQAAPEHVVFLIPGEEGVGLAHNVAACVDEPAPQRARLVPARIASVRAEDEQQRERGHGEAERQRRQRHRLPVRVEEAEHARVRHTGQVLVVEEEHVGHHDGRRRECHDSQLLRERLVDPAAADRHHVTNEAIARAVPHPVVVHEDRPPVLALQLGERTALPPPRCTLIAAVSVR
mmetsp:Transcript_34002/g.85216  ORF Transcript_34002/g.85216 Transcript_34002/m.85216 type:complete len:447 (+) Transcript_34002:133-1473(+)